MSKEVKDNKVTNDTDTTVYNSKYMRVIKGEIAIELDNFIKETSNKFLELYPKLDIIKTKGMNDAENYAMTCYPLTVCIASEIESKLKTMYPNDVHKLDNVWKYLFNISKNK